MESKNENRPDQNFFSEVLTDSWLPSPVGLVPCLCPVFSSRGRDALRYWTYVDPPHGSCSMVCFGCGVWCCFWSLTPAAPESGAHSPSKHFMDPSSFWLSESRLMPGPFPGPGSRSWPSSGMALSLLVHSSPTRVLSELGHLRPMTTSPQLLARGYWELLGFMVTQMRIAGAVCTLEGRRCRSDLSS